MKTLGVFLASSLSPASDSAVNNSHCKGFSGASRPGLVLVLGD